MGLSKKLITRIEEQFRLRDSDIRAVEILDIVEITGGWESPIFSFRSKITKSSGSVEQGHVIRFYVGDGAIAQARKDFQIMTRVNQFGVPTPGLEFVIFAEDKPREAYLVMEKIEGPTVAEQKASKRAIRGLADYQAVLHKLDWREIWKPEGAQELTGQDYVRLRMERLKDAISQLEGSDFDCTLAWLEERFPAESSVELSLLHNDYHPENALVREADGAMFIIDWTFAEPGEARMDLAWTLLQVSIMLGAEAREDYLKAYEKELGESVKDLAFFEALKFAERMLTIAQWMQPDFEIPIRKISKDALRGSYKVHVINVYARLKAVTGCEIPLIETL